MAAKQISPHITLCHPLSMTHIDTQFIIDTVQGVIHIEAQTCTNYKTGVKVEAVTAATLAAILIFDIYKSGRP